MAVRVAAHSLYVVAHLLAHQRESALTEHLAQRLFGFDYLDAVSLLLLSDEAADAWRFAPRHDKHHRNLRQHHLNQREHHA